MFNDKRKLSYFIIIVTCLVFFPCLNADFLTYDDNVLIYQNSHVLDFNWGRFFQFYTLQNWILFPPLSILSFVCEFQFFQLNPLIYHLDNIILHVLNALLVFFLVLRFGFRQSEAFIIAVLFALNPLKVESVAWVSERRDLLYAFFYLLGGNLFIDYIKNKFALRYLVFVLLAFGCSVLSKPQGVMFPFFMMLIIFYYKSNFIRFGHWLRIGSVISGGMLVIVMLCVAQHLDFFRVMSVNWGRYALVINEALFAYLIKPVFPYHVALIYPVEEIFTAANIALMPIKFVVNVVLIYIIGRLALKDRGILLGAGIFLINSILLLVLPLYGSLVDDQVTTYNDRYSYLSSLGIYIILIRLAFLLWESRIQYRKYMVIVLIVYVSLMGALTFTRTFVWKNSGTLFTDQIQQYPNFAGAYNSRAVYWLDKGLPDLASKDLMVIEKLGGSNLDYKFYLNKCRLNMMLGNNKLALDDITQVINLNSDYSNFYLIRAQLLTTLKRDDLAILDFQRAQVIKHNAFNKQ